MTLLSARRNVKIPMVPKAADVVQPRQSITAMPAQLVQRKCACGSAAGLTGECEECRRERLGGSAFPVQAKLTVNRPGDRFEREADEVAEQIASAYSPTARSRPVQRLRGGLGRKGEEEENEEAAQAERAGDGLPVVTRAAETSLRDLRRSGGRPLPPDTRAFMEARFGWRFDQVRIHTDDRAHQVARALRARAFTSGRDVVFSRGEFRPQESGGRRLLAHELTHTLQQRADRRPVVQRAPASTDPAVPEAPGPEAPGPEAPGPEAPGPEAPGPEAPGPEAPGPEPADTSAAPDQDTAGCDPRGSADIDNFFFVPNINPAEKVSTDPQQIDNPHALGITRFTINERGELPKSGVGKTADLLNGPTLRDAEVKKNGPFSFSAYFPRSTDVENAGKFFVDLPVSLEPDGSWIHESNQSALKARQKDSRQVQDRCTGGPVTVRVVPEVGVVEAVEAHEDRHVEDASCAFFSIVGGWTERVTEHLGEERAVTAKTRLGALIKLFKAVGGTRRKTARRLLNRVNQDVRDFHNTDAGRGPKLGKFEVNRDCSVATVPLVPRTKS